MATRRDFLKASAALGMGTMLGGKWQSAYAFSRSDSLQKFIQPLRQVGNGILLATPDTVVQSWWQPGVSHYTIEMGQFTDSLHPDLPNPTRLWGFGQGGNFSHLGGVIAVKRGTPVQITFQNNLPATHILPVDTTIEGADGAHNCTSVHLHGGFTPWVTDGGPHAWFDPQGGRGISFAQGFLNPTAQLNEAEYYYPNQQSARMMWYHDHAIGTTRLNAYAGLASAYVIYDDYELSLAATNGLPGPLDPRTVYLAFQDKSFVPTTIDAIDPTWAQQVPNSLPGDLWYPHVYEPARWALAPGLPPPNPSVMPEFFGDTMLVNGTVFPYLEVEPRQYRFRMLNACNARFLNPRLVYARGSTFPDSAEPSPNVEGPAFIQIGSEGGFLPAPVMLNGPKQPLLLLGPAERADVIADFRNIPPGSILILYNDAPTPFPGGDSRYDHHPKNPKTPNILPGHGPNTRTLLQIRVKAASGPADMPISLPAVLANPDDAPYLVTQTSNVPTPVPAGVTVRRLTLNEAFDAYGRLIQFLGTATAVNPGAKTPLFGLRYDDPPTEVIPRGTTEVWEIINLTADTHPIHFHLVNVQVLSRQPFSVQTYKGGIPNYLGPAVAPDENEMGWKETVRMNPGEVTRVIMKFDLPVVPFTELMPVSPRTGHHEYVWHCHILEHEEHDMMRPLIIS